MPKLLLASYARQALKNMPLTVVLVVPFVVQIFAAVGLVGVLSFRNGQQAVSELATQLSEEVSDRISNQLDSYLRLPPQINQANVDAVELGMLDLKNFEKTGRHFWKQMRLYSVGYLNFAFNNQEFIGVERQDDGQLLINETTLARGITKTAVFSTDDQGNRVKLIDITESDADVREEGWYADAVKAGKPTWTSIYQWDDKPEVLSISHSYPLYTRTNQLIGVIGVDYILTQINTFLRSLKVGSTGRIFVIERSGLVVGTSSADRTFTIVKDKPQRLNVLDSSDPLVRKAARYLVTQFGSFTSIQGTNQLEPILERERQFMRVLSWRDRYGLDWLIVVVIPESDFMEQIRENTNTTILLCCAALAVAILIGMITARSIASPLLKLSGASEAIAGGELDSRVDVQGTSEIKTLSNSFNRMAEMLTESFLRLETANTELESRVQQRTGELAASQSSLQRSNFLLQRREQQLRKQQKVLIELTKSRALNQGDFIIAIQEITEISSRTLNIERVSVWLFDQTKTMLHCLDLYEQSPNLHNEADALLAANYPTYFKSLTEKRCLAVEDALEDPKTQELIQTYLAPLGIVSILDTTFEVGGEVAGVLCFEHVGLERLWLLEEVSFASSLADLLSLGMEAQERRRAEEKLRIEQVRSERLLLNVLPQAIAERLKSSQSASLPHLRTSGTIVADTFEEVTVLFADIVEFTEFASSVSASELVNVLNDIFSEFDRLAERYSLEKIKTIGDAYMVVGGLPTPRTDHAEAIAEMAIEMRKSIQMFLRPDGKPFTLRIGIHTGQAVAGVIGKKKFIYDLWGDTVNIASRMESQGLVGCIQVTEVTYSKLAGKYAFEKRGEITVKGKGKMTTYWLVGRMLPTIGDLR